MKKNILILLLLIGSMIRVQSQVYVASGEQLHIATGEIFSVDSLVLTPSSAFTLTNNTLTHRQTVANSFPYANKYISRVYQFANVTPSFSGTIQSSFLISELNGLTDSLLILQVQNGTSWEEFTPASINRVSGYALSSSLSGKLLREITLGAHTDFIWTGAVNSSYKTPGNWNNNLIPLGENSVIISSNTPQLDTNIHVTGKLVLSNTGKLIVNAGKTVTIGTGGLVDFAGKSVTLKSDATATASIGKIEGTLSGATNVTVERYLMGGNKWQFLSVPTSGQTFKQAWQEGASTAKANPAAGYGFIIGAMNTNWSSLGFDKYNPGGPAVKSFDSNTATWVGISRTDSAMANTSGYMAFVSGNRSETGTTVARTTGTLYQGTQSAISVGANKFVSVGNPYASPVTLTSLSTTGLQDVFYVWDPRLGGSYGLGAYQTLTKNGGVYTILPGGGSYGAANSTVYNIESGAAFFVRGSASGGSIQFTEAAKSSSSGDSRMFSFNPYAEQQITTLLFARQSDSTRLIDGIQVRYGHTFSNEVTDEDILKMANTNESLSILSKTKSLVVEKRNSIIANDSVQLKLSNVRVQGYRYEIKLKNLDIPGVNAYLVDDYLQKTTDLNTNGTTAIDFDIQNIPGSYASNRFKILFVQPGSSLAMIPSLTASRKADKTVAVNWGVNNEFNIQGYELERSENGVDYFKLASLTPKGIAGVAANYSYTDQEMKTGELFYRVRVNGSNGEIVYSPKVKVVAWKGNKMIGVYPNPVKNKSINISFNAAPEGNYKITLVNMIGQVVYDGYLAISAPVEIKTIQLNISVAFGTYRLIVKGPNDIIANDQLIIQ